MKEPKLTRELMARTIVQALCNMPELPDPNHHRVWSTLRNKNNTAAVLEDQYNLVKQIIDGKQKEVTK